MTAERSTRTPSEHASARGWGPDGKRAAVSITFDNLGEAMDIETGTWPKDVPVGRHYSVTDVLPRILEVLRADGLHCTYFVEGWSADVYPEAVEGLSADGHELGLHGWRHEHWAHVRHPDVEESLVTRGVEALRARGAAPRGFRPPGGVMTPSTERILRDAGFTYVSPAARHPAIAQGLAVLPFRWTAIDAYYFFDAFAPLRTRLGDQPDPLPAERFIAGVHDAVDEVVAEGGCLSLLLHPFLLDQPARLDAAEEVITFLANHPDIWCAPCGQHAAWALAHPEALWADAELDTGSWR